MQNVINENERLKIQNRSLQQENRALREKLTNGLTDKEIIELISEIARLKRLIRSLLVTLKNEQIT